tara:strand:+ start:32 stop:376 length:345 start_codon:yes stop_codon:yes gene_type:complete
MYCLIKYNKEIIFLYWKSHINNYIIKTLKLIDDLENLVKKNILNIISHKEFINNCKIKLQLFINIKEDYLCNKNIKSRRKNILIYSYNLIITIIENQDKIYRLNMCCNCNKHNK